MARKRASIESQIKAPDLAPSSQAIAPDPEPSTGARQVGTTSSDAIPVKPSDGVQQAVETVREGITTPSGPVEKSADPSPREVVTPESTPSSQAIVPDPEISTGTRHIGTTGSAAIPVKASDGVQQAVETVREGITTPSGPVEKSADPSPQEVVTLDFEVVHGSIFEQKGLIAVLGRYVDTPPAGALEVLDDALVTWLSRAIQLGIISSELGVLFHIPIPAGRTMNSAVILAGMGEAGRFTRNDLRYLMTNVGVAVLGLGLDRFAVVLIGAGKNGLQVEGSVRGIIDGVADALLRSDAWASKRMKIVIVEEDEKRCRAVTRCLNDLKNGERDGKASRDLVIGDLEEREDPPPRQAFQGNSPPPADVEPRVAPTRLTITTLDARDKDAVTRTMRFSALSESAVIPTRDQEVSSYFLDQLPQRIMDARDRSQQEALGLLMTSYILPAEFHDLLETDAPLALVLDSTSACYPWEMAGVRQRKQTMFLGPAMRLTRQFRSLQSDAPGVPPPINNSLRILVIADPAPAQYALQGARDEGLAVLKVMALAKQCWGERLDVQVTLRIGSVEGGPAIQASDLHRTIPGSESVLESVLPCDPLEVLSILLTRHFDVVHFAGHGSYDPEAMSKGWIFSSKCTLSANEIFKFRQVPRLVFANACHSSKLDTHAFGERVVGEQQVSLAEAFFSRGITNYIGAGWEVADDQGEMFAKFFYLQVMGLRLKDAEVELYTTAPPATLGEAVAYARTKLLELDNGTSWGAYQHYGQVNGKLLPFRNEDDDLDGG